MDAFGKPNFNNGKQKNACLFFPHINWQQGLVYVDLNTLTILVIGSY